MIDESRTLEIYGYTSDELTDGSNKLIAAVCECCGRCRAIRYNSYRVLCSKCCRKGKVGNFYGKYHSIKSRKEMSALRMDRRLSDVTRQRVSAGLRGIPYEEWESYACNSPYCPRFNEACKESNREKYGRECFICGLPECENINKNGKQLKLSVHHVDMNKQQGCDGVRWSLIPVCIKHHGPSHNKLWTARIVYLLSSSEL